MTVGFTALFICVAAIPISVSNRNIGAEVQITRRCAVTPPQKESFGGICHELHELPGAAKLQPNMEVHRRDAEGAESYWTRILADSHRFRQLLLPLHGPALCAEISLPRSCGKTRLLATPRPTCHPGALSRRTWAKISVRDSPCRGSKSWPSTSSIDYQ